MKTSTQIEIEYSDFDEYDVERTAVEATIERDGETVTIEAPGIGPFDPFEDDDIDEPLVLYVGELRDAVAIYRDRTTTGEVDVETGFVTIHFRHDGRYCKGIRSDELATLLHEMETEARNEFAAERGIEPVADAGVEIPDVNLSVESGTISYPSSTMGKSRPVETLVMKPEGDVGGEWDAWLEAAKEAGKRRETWGDQYGPDGESVLIAPDDCDDGDTISLTEWIDAWYLVDPVAVADVAHEQIAEEQAKDTRTKEEKEQDALEEAAQTGEDVVIKSTTTACSDSNKECNLDHVTTVATPNGEIETRRTHTY